MRIRTSLVDQPTFIDRLGSRPQDIDLAIDNHDTRHFPNCLLEKLFQLVGRETPSPTPEGKVIFRVQFSHINDLLLMRM